MPEKNPKFMQICVLFTQNHPQFFIINNQPMTSTVCIKFYIPLSVINIMLYNFLMQTKLIKKYLKFTSIHEEALPE